MTPAQIRNEAAKKLNIFGEGQTLRAAHSDDLDKAYLQVHAELQHDGRATWSSTASIPTRFENPIITLVAFSRASKYNVPMERFQELASEFQLAWRTIYKLAEVGRMGVTEVPDF